MFNRLRTSVLLILIVVSINITDLFSAPTQVTSSARKLLVDGEEFFVKGVCYSPTPVGNSVIASYNWFDETNYISDFRLISAMGANAIRTYLPEGASQSVTETVLDAAWENGLYVALGFPVTVDLSKIDTEINEFLTIVSRYKDHPAILMWVFGNEVTNENSSWFVKLASAAVRAAAIDSNHPVIYAARGLGNIGKVSELADDTNMSSLGLWGINLYKGRDFDTTFSSYSGLSTKPLLITEFGCDAYNSTTSSEDQSMQSEFIISQWNDILANSASCSGGFVFEWSDEWWKKLTANSTLVHDTDTDWTATGTDYEDTAMHEEWWGINSIASGNSSVIDTYNIVNRTAYDSLKSLWFVESNSDTLFKAKPVNYPNPFSAARGGTDINFELNQLPEKIELSIYNTKSKRIYFSRPDPARKFSVNWDASENGKALETGIYILKIKVWESDGRAEDSYRKMLLLK